MTRDGELKEVIHLDHKMTNPRMFLNMLHPKYEIFTFIFMLFNGKIANTSYG